MRTPMDTVGQIMVDEADVIKSLINTNLCRHRYSQSYHQQFISNNCVYVVFLEFEIHNLFALNSCINYSGNFETETL